MKQSSKWLRAFNVFLSSILALLGYTSCESAEEYGSPYAKYEIKGKVLDKESKTAVEGARIIVKPLNQNLKPLSSYYADTLSTDKEGTYLYQNEEQLQKTTRLSVRIRQTRTNPIPLRSRWNPKAAKAGIREETTILLILN